MIIVNAVLGLLMFIGAVIASWLMSRDELNFGVLQAVIALFLLVLFFVVAAFWRSWIAWFRNWNGGRRRSS